MASFTNAVNLRLADGGEHDANNFRFQFPTTYENLKNDDIKLLRLGVISYKTNDPWPTTLP